MNEWDLRRMELVSSISKSDLLRTYASLFREELRREDGTSVVKNTEPWMAVGEQMAAALFSALHGPGWHHPLEPFNYGLDVERSRSAYHMAVGILAAQPFLWPTKMEELAASAPLPPHILDRGILTFDKLFFSREACFISNDDGVKFQHNWQVVFLSNDNKVDVIGDAVDGSTGETAIVPFASYPIGEEVTEDTHHALRMLSFMNSKYIETKDHFAPRHIRRRSREEERKYVERPVSVIHLRQRETQSSHSERGYKHVDWKHQWWVRGYHRKTWLPKTRTHRLDYVPPVLKGPSGLPLLRHIYKVDR
jgi:hypothetical protein